jgi:2-hydroxy-3-keto-5-methylthiopentenyl-1-phosphate phosphatase
VIVSNGCGWYIDKFLQRARVDAVVHTNPGRYEPDRGLMLELPTTSPYYCPETGISKAAVVAEALQEAEAVAFAGDGRPDVKAAQMVAPRRRFAREWLASELERLGEEFQPFDRWSQIAIQLQ